MKRAILLFLFILSVSSTLYAKEQQKTEGDFSHAYIAVAGPGEDLLSYLGHSFLAFSKKEGQFLDAHAYQFNLFPGENEESLMNAPFRVEKEAARYFMARYQLEERAIFLYPLKLSKLEIKKLIENLKDEKLKREKSDIRDYDILDHNCLTTIIKMINQIVDKEKHIPSYWTDGLFSLNTWKSASSLYSNIPLAFTHTLKDQKIIAGKRIVVQPDIKTRIKVSLALKKMMVQSKKTCSFDKSSALEILTKAIQRNDLRETNTFQKRLKTLFQGCSSRKGKRVYKRLLSTMWSFASSQRGSDLIEAYF